jgi:hypothetical protein
MRMDTSNDRIVTAAEGNYYKPTFIKGYMYFIDLANGMQLTRVNLSTDKYEVLDEGKCINYNVSEENNVIYYQLENENDHKLCRMTLGGDNKVVVTEGDCMNIHITKNYTYFYKISGASVEDVTLYTSTKKGENTKVTMFANEELLNLEDDEENALDRNYLFLNVVKEVMPDTYYDVMLNPGPITINTNVGSEANGVTEDKIWVSFERKMSCAVGKCGHCKINETYVCLEGPVFNYTKAKELLD